jgi:alkanesulfonate monooxygenase
MPVEFIGYIGNNTSSEIIPRVGPILDRDYVEAVAKIHDLGGFDRVLLAFHADSPESILVGQHALSVTQRLGVLIAHRPGFTAPTLVARQFATLDHLYPGRTAIHIITGGDPKELARDGNTVADKDERYSRTNEFLDVLRAEWASDKPFDYRGRHYTVEGGFASIRPQGRSSLDVFVGGASQAAVDVAGRHADTFALWGETHDQVRQITRDVRESAARHGRPAPRFSLSLRPILADTEEAAWAKAAEYLERAKALVAKNGKRRPDGPLNEGSKRLLAAAEKGARLDKRLWTELAAVTGAPGNSTALVGTPDQVAEAFLDYYDLGIGTFLIRGFDPLPDAFAYGRELLPRVKALVAERDATLPVAAE